MKDFKVYVTDKPHLFHITAPIRDRLDGFKVIGHTERIFNANTNTIIKIAFDRGNDEF